MADRWCERVQELIPEVALGVAPGDERALALAHVDGCRNCRALLEQAAATADDLLLLAPEHEPPAGFDARVLAAMRPARHRRRAVAILLAAAAALVIAVSTFAGARWASSDDREVEAAVIRTDAGVGAGEVFAHDGDPSWVFMTVEGAPSGEYAVRLVTDDGRVQTLGWCRVEDGTAAWGTAVDVPVGSIDHLEMSWGGTVLRADFPS